MTLRSAIFFLIVASSGCRGAFAEKPKTHREDATSRCGPTTTEIVQSPVDQTVVAWRSGPHVVCWQRPRGVVWKELDLTPTPDPRGRLAFTDDGRTLTYEARANDRAVSVAIDVETGETFVSR